MIWNRIIYNVPPEGWTEIELSVWATTKEDYVESFSLYQKETIERAWPGSFVVEDKGPGEYRGSYRSRVTSWWVARDLTEEEILSTLCRAKTDDFYSVKFDLISVNLIVDGARDRNWGLMWNPSQGLVRYNMMDLWRLDGD